MSTAELERRVETDAAEAVRGLGLVVAGVSVTAAGRRRVVRVSLDRDLSVADPGDETTPVPTVSLDEVAEASTVVSAALDASDALGTTAYVLEVSSPGVGRPLTSPSHFRRNVTRLLEVTRADGTVLTGRLVRAGPADVSLVVEPAGKAPRSEHRLTYAQIERAQVQVEFDRHQDTVQVETDETQEN